MTENPYGTTSRPISSADDAVYAPISTVQTDGYPAVTTYDTTGLPAGSDDTQDASVKDKANDTAAAGKQAAGEVAQKATEQAKDVAQETKKQARDLVGEARSQLTDQAGTQHRNLVTNLRSLADELVGMSQGSDNPGTASDLVSQAGDRAHGIADWLDSREPGDLIGEARTFARQRPGAFLLGAVVAGVLAGRLTRGAVAAHSDNAEPTASVAPSARHEAVEPVADIGGVAP